MKRLSIGLLAGAFATASVLTAGNATAATAQKADPVQAPVQAQKTPSYVPPPINWTTCTNATLVSRGAQCGMLTVPLDYDKPNGTKIKLAVSRVMHKTSDAAYQGVMLVNPGGPGGSGLIYSVLQSSIPHGAGNPYDWIGFDPRGVGDSVPSLTCDGNYFPTNRPDYVPYTKTLTKFWNNKAAGYAKKCQRAGGALLNHEKTTDWVNDMESIRKALKQQKINYYGFSYGTYLGQVYASMHPDRVRRMVFDGVVDPRDVWYEANLNQDVAFEKTENIFFSWVADHDSVYHLGTTGKKVRKLWDQMLDKSRQAPFDGQIGPDEWTDAFLGAGYYVYGWEDTAEAFAAAANGDYKPVEDLYAGANGAGPGSDNTYAVYLSVQCTDLPWPSSKKKIRKDNFKTYAKAPFETWANAQYNAPCSYWKGKAAKAAPKVDGSKAPPILMVAETFDAATPFSGAIEVRKRFPKSILIEGVNGTTHAGSLSGVTCTDDRIADYLLTGALDKRVRGNQSDVKCDPVPQPEPTAGSSLEAQKAAPSMPKALRQGIIDAQR